MNSQEDLFEGVDTQKPTKVKYDSVVLCDKDEAVKNPFQAYPRSMFSSTEIQDRWLECLLDDSSRLKSLPTFEGMPNKQFSLFLKIEKGTQQYTH